MQLANVVDPVLHVLAGYSGARYRRSGDGGGYRESRLAAVISDRAFIMSSGAGMSGVIDVRSCGVQCGAVYQRRTDCAHP